MLTKPLAFSSLAFALLVQIGTFTVCGAQSSTNPDYELGYKLYHQGLFPNAKPIFEKAMRQTPNSMPIMYYYACTCMRLGLVGQACEIYQRIVQLFPGSRGAVLSQQMLLTKGVPQDLYLDQRFNPYANTSETVTKDVNLLTGPKVIFTPTVTKKKRGQQ